MTDFKSRMRNPTQPEPSNGEPAHSVNRLRSEPAAAQTVYSSEQLFGSQREIAIRHDGSVYRLRITRQHKLILNK